MIPCEYRYKWYTAETDSLGYILLAEYVGVSSTTFT